MNHTQKNINALVCDLLKKDSNLKTKWKSEALQTQLKTILMKNKSQDKDENHPKRAKSPYLFFCDENRTKVRDELGDNTKATDITRELGARWQKLTKDSKASAKKQLKKYEKLAEEDGKRYKNEKAEYLLTKNIKKGPKRAKSAYLFFCEDKRPEVLASMPDKSKVTDVTKKLGELWRVESSKGKISKYEELAKADKARYFEEKSKEEKKEKTESLGYKKFENEELKKEEYKSLSEAELKKKLTTKWKSLNSKQKASY
jgi:hypothetical protein